jgi:hypothetical protein
MIKEGLIVINILPSNDYKESEVYATDIFTSQNGTEKRVKKTNTLKRAISYSTYAINEQKVESMEEIITYALKYNCLHPLWFSETKVLNTGDTNTILCDTTKSDFKTGDYALIRKDFFTFYCEKITEITPNSITLKNSINIKEGISVLPLIRATPDKSLSYNFTTSRYSKWKLNFTELL